VHLERGPLSHLSTIEELLGRKSRGFGQENRAYGCGDPLRWPRGIPLCTNVDTNFAESCSLGRYSSLAVSGHWLFLIIYSLAVV
jgi:hypothetical protein